MFVATNLTTRRLPAHPPRISTEWFKSHQTLSAAVAAETAVSVMRVSLSICD